MPGYVTDLLPGDVILESDGEGNIFNEAWLMYAGNEVVFKVERGSGRTTKHGRKILHKSRNPQVFRPYENIQGWPDKVLRFFEWHDYDFRLPRLLMNAIQDGDNEFLRTLHPLIPHLDKIDEHIYNARWDELLSKLQPGDMLLTSRIADKGSRLIRRVTHGPWSHSAICYDETTVAEMLTTGMAIRPIDVYRDGFTRVGLYRPVSELDISKMRDYIDKFIRTNPAYGYHSAAALGLANLMGLTVEKLPTPMDLVYSGILWMVAYV